MATATIPVIAILVTCILEAVMLFSAGIEPTLMKKGMNLDSKTATVPNASGHLPSPSSTLPTTFNNDID